MALITRNGEQADGWKVEISFTADEIARLVADERHTFSEGQDLTQIHGQPVAELIVSVGA